MLFLENRVKSDTHLAILNTTHSVLVIPIQFNDEDSENNFPFLKQYLSDIEFSLPSFTLHKDSMQFSSELYLNIGKFQ